MENYHDSMLISNDIMEKYYSCTDAGYLLAMLMSMPIESCITTTTTITNEVINESKENGWIQVEHHGGMIPRLLQLQARVNLLGDMPIYRHPTDHYYHPIPFTSEIQKLAIALQKVLKEVTNGYNADFNHCLLQWYRSGTDYISEHADKTLDIKHDSYILNYSLGSTRVLILKPKKDTKNQFDTMKVNLMHNTCFVMGPDTNRQFTHGIKQDKRADRDKRNDELSYDCNRISFTFREIHTYIDMKDKPTIYGQGAKKRNNDQGRIHEHDNNNSFDKSYDDENDDDDCEEMTTAFGIENRSSKVTWVDLYSNGFNALCSRSPVFPPPPPPPSSSTPLLSSPTTSSLALKSQVYTLKSGPVKLGIQVVNHDVNAIHPREIESNSCLIGTYCILVPLNASIHSQELYEAYSLDTNDEMWNYMSYGPWKSAQEYKLWIESMQLTKHDEYMYAIVDKRTSKPTGVCSYLRINCIQSKSIEIGHLTFSKQMQRSCVSSECLIMMIRNAFSVLGFRRVEWKCNVLNLKSIQCAERLGFTFEGVHRNAIINKGRNRDTAWFSIIEEEFNDLNEIYTHWFNDCIDTVTGSQLISLRELTLNFSKQTFPNVSIKV